MADKDPKDMTASELLRLAANGFDGSSGIVMEDLASFMGLGRNARHSESLYKLADKIDAELAEARGESLRQGAMVWAKANSWPDLKEGEDFGAWLERCAVPRPRFEDGEPVQSSDMDEIGTMATYRVYMDGSWEFEPDKYEDERNPKPWDVQFGARNDRVRRPAPEVLGADGLPIKVGETVYMAGSLADTPNDKAAETVWAHGGPLLVLGESDRAGCLICKNDMGVKLDVRPEDLTHTPPDTQERIDEDITLSPIEYCADILKLPNFDVMNYSGFVEAMIRDLLRRQRELDARKGGAE